MSMDKNFVEMITFQVKPDSLAEFEALIERIKPLMAAQPGCTGTGFFKRFYTFDNAVHGEPPRELTRIVKCVKYYAWWEFETIEDCGRANGWFFENHSKEIMKLLIMPFDINSGYTL